MECQGLVTGNSQTPRELVDEQLDGAFEVVEGRMLDGRDSQLAVDPGVYLAMGASVAARDLGDEPVTLVAQPRPPLERRDPVRLGLGMGIRDLVGRHPRWPHRC